MSGLHRPLSSSAGHLRFSITRITEGAERFLSCCSWRRHDSRHLETYLHRCFTFISQSVHQSVVRFRIQIWIENILQRERQLFQLYWRMQLTASCCSSHPAVNIRIKERRAGGEVYRSIMEVTHIFECF